MRFSTKHLQFVLVAVGVAALVAIDLYAGNKDQSDVPLAEQQQENGINESMSPNLERRAEEGSGGGGDMLNELDMYNNNNMLDASLAAHGEELPAAAYPPQMLGQDDQDQQIQPGAMDRYEVKPDAPKPAYMLPPPKKQPPPRPVQPLQQVPPPAAPQPPPQLPRPAQPKPAQPKPAQTKPVQQKPKPQPRPIKPNFLEQAAKISEATSAERAEVDYNPSANAGSGGLRGGVDAGRNQVQDASYHPHLPQNQGTISEIEVVEGEVQRRKTRATLLTGSLFGGLFVVYKAASMGYLLF